VSGLHLSYKRISHDLAFLNDTSNLMTKSKKRIQQDINDLIKSVSETKGMILTYPLLVDFFDGDHNAAVLLNQILYWTDRTTDPAGWFYKTYDEWQAELRFSYYQVQRVISGDERVQNPKRNLSDVGLETKVKMAPNGRNATYYRLDVPQFVGMFVEWIEAKFGELTAKVKSVLKPKKLKSEQAPTPDTDSLPSWFPQPEPDLTPTAQIGLPWDGGYHPDQTVTDAWKTAQGQLEIQFDRASFDTYFKRLTLVDYDPALLTFTLAVRDPRHIDLMRDRLHPTIQRVLSDVFGRGVEISYVTHDEWRDRHR
jgi:hypothetical protein